MKYVYDRFLIGYLFKGPFCLVQCCYTDQTEPNVLPGLV